MKYIILVILMFFCFSTYSQNVKLGIRGGANFANYVAHNASGNKVANNPFQTGEPFGVLQPTDKPVINPYYKTNFMRDVRTGFFLSLLIDWELEKKWNMETGLGYFQKGIDLKYSYNISSVNVNNSVTTISYQFNRDVRTNYLTIPTVLRYKIDRKERFYVLGGTYNAFALNLGVHNSTSINNTIMLSSSGQLQQQSRNELTFTSAYAHIFDFGIIGGFGFDWPLKNRWSVGIDIRGAMGLINVPGRYEEAGFLSFSPKTKNINIETGLKLLYSMK